MNADRSLGNFVPGQLMYNVWDNYNYSTFVSNDKLGLKTNKYSNVTGIDEGGTSMIADDPFFNQTASTNNGVSASTVLTDSTSIIHDIANIFGKNPQPTASNVPKPITTPQPSGMGIGGWIAIIAVLGLAIGGGIYLYKKGKK